MKILFIDDNPNQREALSLAFAEMEYEYEVCEYKECVLKKLDKGSFDFDVVFLDYRFDDKNGKELDYNGVDIAEEIRKRHPKIPIIMITAYVKDREVNNEIAASGVVDGCVDKFDYDLEFLETVITNAIAKAKKRSPLSKKKQSTIEIEHITKALLEMSIYLFEKALSVEKIQIKINKGNRTTKAQGAVFAIANYLFISELLNTKKLDGKHKNKLTEYKNSTAILDMEGVTFDKLLSLWGGTVEKVLIIMAGETENKESQETEILTLLGRMHNPLLDFTLFENYDWFKSLLKENDLSFDEENQVQTLKYEILKNQDPKGEKKEELTKILNLKIKDLNADLRLGYFLSTANKEYVYEILGEHETDTKYPKVRKILKTTR